MPTRSLPRRPALAAVALGLLIAVSACTPPSGPPPAPVAQDPPFGVNGMAVDRGRPDSTTATGGPTVWVADLFGGQLVRFDPTTGVVLERYGMDRGLCRVDDLVVLTDGTLVATCPTDGLVVRVERGGAATVLAAVGRSVNPIAIDPTDPTGRSVLVGFGTEDDRRLLRVPVDGGPVEVVADGLPVLNGFGVDDAGRLVVPTGGAGGLLGTGGVGRIDVATGTFTPIALSFPGEPGRTGFSFACGADVAPPGSPAAGTIYVAQCVDAAVFAVDPDTGVATRFGTSPVAVADNVVALGDGRVVLSGFFGGVVTVFAPDGTPTVRPIGG